VQKQNTRGLVRGNRSSVKDMGQWIIDNPTCPICKHPTEIHVILQKMGMTVCKYKECKCLMTFDYSEKTLEEMR
jgi:hypothetical protein